MHKVVESEKKSKSTPQLTSSLKEKTKKFLNEYAKKEVMANKRKAKKEGGQDAKDSPPDGAGQVDDSFDYGEDPSTTNTTTTDDGAGNASLDIKFGDSEDEDDGSGDDSSGGEEDAAGGEQKTDTPAVEAVSMPGMGAEPEQNGMDMMHVTGDDLMYLDDTLDFDPPW